MKRLAYLAPHPSTRSAWDGVVDVPFEAATLAAGIPTVIGHPFRWVATAGRVLRRSGAVRAVVRGHRACLVLLPYVSEYKLFPASYFSEIVPYCYDCWPAQYDYWLAMFRRHRVKVAFVSARQSAEHLAAHAPKTEIFWMPEACGIESYDPGKKLTARTIDVIEFGRKYRPFHSRVVELLQARGFRHCYEFLEREALRQKMADSRISVCFPRLMTHADDTGGVETVTLRYFETMASGCLPLGRCPAELKDFFGYDPMIEADLEHPFEQLESLLQNIETYQPLVERNLATVRRLGSWQSRVGQMLDILRPRGYEIPGVLEPARA
jgi:hypothetical protein